MRRYVASRLGVAVLTLFGMSVVIFVLLRLAPGSIVDILFATGGYVNEAEKRLIMAELGLDRPIWAQYLRWIADVVSGDLGKSYRYDLPAWQLVKPLIPVTVELALISTAIADRKSTRLNSSHEWISYAVFCL